MISFDRSLVPDINECVRQYQATEGALLLDLRSRQEWRDGHVPGSTNVPFPLLAKLPEMVPDKDTPLFVHCLIGKKSFMAEGALHRMGYTNVVNAGAFEDYKGPQDKE